MRSSPGEQVEARAVIQRGESYDEVYGGFRWELPEWFNIGVAACDRHADGSGRLALVYEAPDGTVERFSYDDLKRLSNRCANALAGMGWGLAIGSACCCRNAQKPRSLISRSTSSAPWRCRSSPSSVPMRSSTASPTAARGP